MPVHPLTLPARPRALPGRRAGVPGRLVRPAAALAAGSLLALAGASGPAALVLGVAVGLPHGALDHLPARRLLAPRLGRAWPVAFAAGYLGLAGLVLASWAAAPLATLALFLGASVLHFGEEDTVATGLAARVAHGGLPILAPTLFHPDAVAQLFAWVAGSDPAPLMAWLLGPALLIWLACAGVTAVQLVGEARWRAPLAEAAALLALFALAPPLLAFACYFALVHTPRALDGMGEPATLLRQAMPLTIAGAVIGLALWLRSPALDVSERTVRTVFQLLSALTAPHMVLRWLTRYDAPKPAVRLVGGAT